MKVFEGERVPIKAWIDDVFYGHQDLTSGVFIETEALKQAQNIATLPFVFKHVALMPDVHAGKGSTVGSVVATKNAIVPAMVGVDIGCGMCAVKTSLKAEDLPDDLKKIRHQIERDVPHGNDKFRDHQLPDFIADVWDDKLCNFLHDTILQKHPKIATKDSPAYQLGTLGGGNHFIEVCLDEENSVWIMLHSGSRGIGNRIGSYFIEQARDMMDKFFVNLPDKDLAYLPKGTELFSDYTEALFWAQQYARTNRDMMLQSVVAAVQRHTKPFEIIEEAINCHHNYVEIEQHFGENVYVTRKGAVRAREGDLGIIPGSMGARSYIVRGKGNPESFHSCSHGAGRTMSRTKAKQKFTVEDQIKATEGVECRKDEGVIDEIPHAYKPIDKVMESQSDLVETVAILKQVLCVKG